jgi:hypothetical protein
MHCWRVILCRIRLFFNLCCDEGAHPVGQAGLDGRSYKRGKIMVKPAIVTRCGKQGGFGVTIKIASINGQLVNMASPIFSSLDIG